VPLCRLAAARLGPGVIFGLDRFESEEDEMEEVEPEKKDFDLDLYD